MIAQDSITKPQSNFITCSWPQSLLRYRTRRYLLSAKKLEENSESLWQNDVGQNNFKNYFALYNFA
jgi:hypothetical protein